MKKTKLFTAITLAIGVSTLTACGGGSSTTSAVGDALTATPTPSTPTPNPVASRSSLLGSAFKGPIDAATTKITDATGTVLATGTSTDGKFELTDFTLPTNKADAVFIETQGGSYTDEATGEIVAPAQSKGLMTVFTVEELQTIITDKKVIALTPETTLLAKMVKKMLEAGTPASEAIATSKATIQEQFIDGTNPAAGAPGDTLFLVGDLSAPTPADQAEALARNRAISFSYEVESLNLDPSQVFDLIEKRALDLEDGALDGKEKGMTSIVVKDKDNNDVSLDDTDQKTNYGLARSRLLNNTITRLGNGEFSENELQSLSQLGVNTDFFTQLNQGNQDAADNTNENLTATNLPAFNRLPVLADEDGNPNDNLATYTLTATPNVNVTINAPGESWTTPMLRYNGSQLPPVIKAKRGDTMTLNLFNNLSEETTIHWHGFKIPGDQDGGPDFPVAAGSGKTYSFPMLQPAAPLWFHPHPDMKTGEQVYKGLAGVYLLEDEISNRLTADKKLPTGDYDIPMLIQDRRFQDEVNGVRELAYKTRMMDNDGMLGDKILVNGAELPKLEVATKQYRFRLYNTSNARTYDFALHDGSTFKVVGTDGGLLPQPVETDHILLGAAERAEIVIDFGKYAVGDKVMLISKAFNGSAMMGMMSGMGGNGMPGGMPGMNGIPMNRNHANENNVDMDSVTSTNGTDMTGMNMAGMNMAGMNMAGMNMAGMNMAGMDMAGMDMAAPGMNGIVVNGMRLDIMRFDVSTQVTDDVTLYDALPANADINTQRLTAADASKTRNFLMTPARGSDGGMSFVINGKAFDLNRIDELVNLAEGDTEIWSIQNHSPMAHPFHAHAIQWQILDRNGRAASGVDLGWKDTVLVQPGETVRFIGRFDPAVNTGDYMYHCHILEHEDAGMMGFFRIQ